jgi:hypothetical protein
VGGRENQKAKGKRQKAKMKTPLSAAFDKSVICFFIFAFCHLPFAF